MKSLFNKKLIERFSRQIVLKNIGIAGQQKILKSKVLIVGSGGLGCPVADGLCRAGVVTIGIVDNDKVSLSNIHRQSFFTSKDVGKLKVKVLKERIKLINPEIVPIQAYLGALGMPGLSAYAGLLEVCKLKVGENVLVSAAAGAVGSVVCQIAKAKGCKVYGTSGSDEKCRWLEKELGIDKAINYKKVDNLISEYRSQITDGIDVYFENVGGDHLEAAINILNVGGRIALCGMIDQYNDEAVRSGPPNLMILILKNACMEGFIVSKYNHLQEQFLNDMKGWIDSGNLSWKETVVEGIDNAPKAFINLFSGKNTGKMLVKIS